MLQAENTVVQQTWVCFQNVAAMNYTFGQWRTQPTKKETPRNKPEHEGKNDQRNTYVFSEHCSGSHASTHFSLVTAFTTRWQYQTWKTSCSPRTLVCTLPHKWLTTPYLLARFQASSLNPIWMKNEIRNFSSTRDDMSTEIVRGVRLSLASQLPKHSKNHSDQCKYK